MENREPVILVSACLLGVACRYNGTAKKNERVLAFVQGRRFVPVCPESLSGLPVPRPPAEFVEGDGSGLRSGRSRVSLREGAEVSREFLRGAAEAVKISRLVRAGEAILKDRSPSCGVYEVYQNGRLVPGVGCFTAMLLLEGVAVKSENDI